VILNDSITSEVLMRRRRLVFSLALAAVCALPAAAQRSQPSRGGAASIQAPALREWLTYIASDELGGRATFSEGLGLAGAYIADHLREWGVKPGGDNGSYFQTIRVLGIKATSRSSVTVEVNGRTRTFAHGGGVTFPTNVGGRQTLKLSDVRFVGYGLNAGAAHDDYAGQNVKGTVVVYLGSSPPSAVDQREVRRTFGSRASYALEEREAAAAIGPPGGGRGRGQRQAGPGAAATPARGQAPAEAQPAGRGRGRGGPAPTPDFTTVQRLDASRAPQVTATDEFFEFLFADAPTKYAELKDLAAKQAPLPRFALDGVTLTFTIDADYETVQTQYTRNVVGIVEGGDPKMKSTYVAFGAHYDHVGYSQGPLGASQTDRISNGADDDGSGTVSLMAIARAFALGPKPKRSLLFVWHAGEERGLWGSRYFADYPSVPIDSIVAQLNMDMVGRNKDDRADQANTVFVVGSDRISTELHNLNVAANASLPRPLTLDYAMNDPSDPERIYYRSDHYSYAAKGIPIVFFFTGLHPDYHRVTDHADKIEYEKMARIGQLVYATGRRVADLDRPPVRDNKGPRAGKGFTGAITDR
jgi:hypothetical protein